jgi:hypothetical protein
MNNEADALQLARQARRRPDRALGQRSDPDTMQEILGELRTAQEPGREDEYQPSDEQRRTAAATGANPRLVAAAAVAIDRIRPAAVADLAHPENNSGGWNARRWVTRLLDPATLDRIARASGRIEALEAFDAAAQARDLQRQVNNLREQLAVANAANEERDNRMNQLRADLDRIAAGRGRGRAEE